jgi:hydroxypyruvate isomerase
MGDLDLVANASILWPGLDTAARVRAAAADGFSMLELWWPFPTPVPDAADVDALLGALAEAGIRLTGMNLWAGDMAAGERGMASHPARADDFGAALRVAARIARRTDMAVANALYGQRLPGVAPDDQDRAATRSLAHAAEVLADAGVTLLIEPLARGLNGAYPITTAAEAVAVLDRLDAAGQSAALLLDTFHLSMNGEDLEEVVARYGDRNGHVQLADSPGRGAPGTGTVDFAGLFDALARSGYAGRVAAEYVRADPASDSYDWAATLPLRR